MQEVVFPVRLFYAKTGRARFISHLDTMRTMTRAFRRSGLPCWYTQGFNPHLYLTFLLPLALGVESLCEIVDFRLTEEMDLAEVAKTLADCLPPGFGEVRAEKPVQPATAVAWAEYDIALTYPEEEREAMLLTLRGFFGKAAIEVTKKTKKGETRMDIRPHTALLGCEATAAGLGLRVRLAAGPTLNVAPKLLLDAFFAGAHAPEAVRVVRTRVLDHSLRDFS